MMQQQHLLSAVRRAIQDYDMIRENDRIAIGVSGGKDSLILAYALRQLQRFYPKSFDLIGITVDLGFEHFDLTRVQQFFELLEIPFEVCHTQIGKIIFEVRKESNPCALCSKMRKAALYDYAMAKGFYKIALGHNQDDINETLLMSLFYEGRIHTMPPVNTMGDAQMTLIRPLIYVKEKDICQFTQKKHFPITKSPCPADGKTSREATKQVIIQLQKNIPKLSANLFGAIQRSKIEGWEMKGEK